ncbi:hypothetical protein PHLCEN_2v3443 [Hermanssonia centrifuga]|uniref:Uncharacterized protein n=1 Tax=Hermanssonia centrifuga TaxID=98765 RepID=A0A2R6QIQ2_9APHY|nr:hypothetical protein PHLCEN_2v3443 [Hermanssonia centrifuga]
MADPLEIAVQSILRDSEQVKIAIHTRATPSPSEQEDTNLNTRKYSSSEGSGEKKRVLAIVTHIDISSGDEQGCVFILRPKNNSATVVPDNYVVEHVFPVLEKFSIAVAQARRNTANASSSTAKNKSPTGNVPFIPKYGE